VRKKDEEKVQKNKRNRNENEYNDDMDEVK
jgi:hypothetical protein